MMLFRIALFLLYSSSFSSTQCDFQSGKHRFGQPGAITLPGSVPGRGVGGILGEKVQFPPGGGKKTGVLIG